MNLFTERLPDCIRIGDTKYPIHTDFRVWVQVEQLLSTSSRLSVDSIVSLYKLVFPPKSKLPKDIGDTMAELLDFFRCGERDIKKKSNSTTKTRIVSFSEDSGLIYAAFLSQYHIDLTETEYIHWWKFRALFDGLWSTHRISEIMGYRGEDLSKIKDKNQRKFYKDMQNRYKLPDIRSLDEIERDNMANLEKIF